jgi:hypothetical protein
MFPFELKPLEVKIVAHVGMVLVIDINDDKKTPRILHVCSNTMLKYENMTDHVINSWKLPPYHLMGKPFNLKHLNGKKKIGPNLMQKA